MKKHILYIVLFLFFIVLQVKATTSNYTTFSDGNVLSASDLNNLQTHYTNADNAILNGDTFTGNMLWHSGSDALYYSDTGSTLKAAIYGDSGKIIGANFREGHISNINIVNATTSETNDSIAIQCGGATCSATNPGFVVTGDGTNFGTPVIHTVTSAVTINLTGAHFGQGTLGDISDAIVRVLAVNDNGTLKWCAAYLGNRKTLVPGDTTTTGSSATTPESALCNTAVTNSNNLSYDIGWVRANFDDTGGASEDLWAVQSDAGDINYGSADGYWQPYNIQFFGFSADPTSIYSRWTQQGTLACIKTKFGNPGTSNSTIFRINGPVKTLSGNDPGFAIDIVDGGSNGGVGGWLALSSDGTLLSLTRTGNFADVWTSSGNKNGMPQGCYEASQ